MFKKVGTVFVIMGVTVAFGFLKNILLARGLSKADFGLFNLIMTLAGLIYPLSMVGQQNTVVRFFSKNKPEEYNWKGFFNKLLLLAFSLALIGSTLSAFIYKFDINSYVFLLVVIVGSVIADLYTYVFRATGRYETSIFLHRSIRIAFPIVLLFLISLKELRFDRVLYALGFLYILHSAVVILYTSNRIGNGYKNLNKADYKDGLVIMCSDISMLVIMSVDKLFLGRLVDLERVGEYFAIFAVTRIFEIAQHSIDFVLIPHSNRATSIDYKNIFYKVLGIGSAISLFYIVFGKPIIHFLYSGKYDSSMNLIPYFCVLCMLQLLHVVPASIIKGRLAAKALKVMTVYDSILMILSVFATYYLILVWGMVGALVAASSIWFLRTLAAYFVLSKYYEIRGSQGLSFSIQETI